MKEFKGKVAVITGAAAGIGRAIAEHCVREGMRVVLTGINEENLTRAEAELKALGGTVISVQTDVAKRSNVEAWLRKHSIHLVRCTTRQQRRRRFRWVSMGGNMERLGVGDRRQSVGGDLRSQGIYPDYARSEHRLPHREYRFRSGLDRGRLLRTLFGDQTRGGSPLRKPLPGPAAAQRAHQGVSSLPRFC